MPRAVGMGAAGGGLRRACTTRVMMTKPARTPTVMAHEPNQPTWSASRNPFVSGKAPHTGYAHVQNTAPATKLSKVTTIVDCPDPTAYKVPEAHEPANCMPIANSTAPMARGSPSRPGTGPGL